MAVKGNTGNVEVMKDLLMWTGIAKATVLAINPTLAELNKKLGVSFEKEPNYLDQDQDGNTRVRMDFWLHCQNNYTTSDNQTKKVDAKVKIAFFITKKQMTKQDGSGMCYINNFGQTCWSTSIDAMPTEKWFKLSGARVCNNGEDALINFIRNWVNAGKDDEVFLDDVDKLFVGDMTEMNSLLSIYKDNILRVMLTVVRSKKDGKYYQSVYNRYFARCNQTSVVAWQKHITGDKRNVPVKANEGAWSYVIQEFVPTAPVPVSDIPSPEIQEESTVWTE